MTSTPRTPKIPFVPLFSFPQHHLKKANKPKIITTQYSLSKIEAEMQADSICRRYEDIRIASFRMHEVQSKKDLDRDEELNKKVLWSFSDPQEVARACLLGVTVEKDWKKGHEVFYCTFLVFFLEESKTITESPPMMMNWNRCLSSKRIRSQRERKVRQRDVGSAILPQRASLFVLIPSDN